MNTDDSVKIKMTFKAPVQRVWKTWTDPEQVLRWFGSDPNGMGIHAHLDVRPTGNYEITFQDSDHTEHTCRGSYIEVREFNKLIFTWTWKSEPGVESLVTVLFIPNGAHTQMQFEHAQVGTRSVHDYVAGWKDAFSKLDLLLRA